ncbi:transcriptional regulatory protein FixJ [Aureimonas sp. SA4125]|uniref:response regulator transcription factor n=1 Tax=Aureimonas sp. SA4125 TaxID=2826993 RepID=UPI001CC3B8C7|nr:response regulator [Aureimonas sp. SA4125]BDA86381.1 transcriptional regulatory protein FixJ [Aureimonas sp. SA4125]
MTRSTVCLVDDDEAVLGSLTALLETVGYNVRSYLSAQEFLRREITEAASSRIDCLITDFRMPEMTGVELQQRLSDAGADFPVIVVTAFGEVRAAVAALKLGAHDFIEKPFEEEGLIRAVEGAIGRAQALRTRSSACRQARDRFATLSPRETEILGHVASGAPSRTIALRLGISPRTVEIHRTNLMRKSGAKSIAELVGLAHEAAFHDE